MVDVSLKDVPGGAVMVTVSANPGVRVEKVAARLPGTTSTRMVFSRPEADTTNDVAPSSLPLTK
jgi:hypothetical protein